MRVKCFTAREAEALDLALPTMGSYLAAPHAHVPDKKVYPWQGAHKLLGLNMLRPQGQVWLVDARVEERRPCLNGGAEVLNLFQLPG